MSRSAVENYENQPVETAASLFDQNRRQMAFVLNRVEPAVFSRTGRYSERGLLTLPQLIEDYAKHLDRHL